MNREKQIKLSPELEARLRKHLKSKQPLFGEDSPWSGLLQGMVNAMLEGELEHHLNEERTNGKKNKRNGHSHKRVITDGGMLEVSTPRDRLGTFDKLYPNHFLVNRFRLESFLLKSVCIF